MHDTIRETFNLARQHRNQAFTVIVSVSSFVFALALGFTFKEHLHFLAQIGAHKLTEAVSAKRQEIVYYLATLTFVPLFALLCCGFWVIFSALCAALTKNAKERILRQDAFTYLLLLLVLERGYLPSRFAGEIGTPLLLFLIAQVMLFSFHLLISKKGGCEELEASVDKPTDGTILTKKPKIGEVLWARTTIPFHGIPIACGACLTVFLLILGSPKEVTALQCWEMLFFILLGTWGFWVGYSALLSALTPYSFADILRADSVTYFPSALLLFLTVFFRVKHAATILALIVVTVIVALKIFAFLQLRSSSRTRKQQVPACLPHRSALQRKVSILNVIMISGLIYVFLYNSNASLSHAYTGANNISGIDLYHEGERMAVVNELLRGGIPYRDVYLQHGLFQNAYKPLLAMKFFGETLEADRRLHHIVYPLGYICFYLLALQCFRRRATALFVAFALILLTFGLAVPRAYLPVTDRHILGFLSLMLLCKWTHRGDGHGKSILVVAGVCTTLAVFYSLDTGLYTWAVSSLFLFLFGLASIWTRSANIDGTAGNPSSFRGRIQQIRKGVLGKCLSPLLTYELGVMIGFTPFLIFFGVHGAIDDMFRSSWTQFTYHTEIWGTPFIPLLSELSKITSLFALSDFILSETFMWYFPILVYLMTLTFLLFRAIANQWRMEDWKLLLILLAGIIFFRTALGRSDWHHVIFSSSFFWLICFFFFERVWLAFRSHESSEITSKSEMNGEPVKADSSNDSTLTMEPDECSDASSRTVRKAKKSRIHLPQLICSLIFVLGLLWYIRTDLYGVFAAKPLKKAETMLVNFTKYGSIPQGYAEVRVKRAGRVLTPVNEAAQIEQVVKYLQENTDSSEPIFDFANQGVYYFLANRPNPTRFAQIAYASPKPLQKEVIADLEETKPKLVIFGEWNTSVLPLVAEYLQSHYTEAIQLGNVSIWKRR